MKIGIQWAMDHKNRFLDMADVLMNGKAVIINAETGQDETVDLPIKAYVASYGQYSDNTILAVCSSAEAAKAACQKKYAKDVADHQEFSSRELPKELTWFNWKDEPTPVYNGENMYDREVIQNCAVEGDFYVEVFNYE